jgi:hypothetical protein
MRGFPVTSADIIASLPFLTPHEQKVIVDVALVYLHRFMQTPPAASGPTATTEPTPQPAAAATTVAPKAPEVTSTYIRRFCGDPKCRGCIYNLSLKNDPAAKGNYSDIKPLQVYLSNSKWKSESTDNVEKFVRNILCDFKIERIHVDHRGYAIVTFFDHAVAVDAFFLLTENLDDDFTVNFNRGKKTMPPPRPKKSLNNK